VWHFQAVHHGIWDYDFPCAPNLIDITVNGKKIKAVAQVSKQGFVYVFDRVTGEPVWPIEERPVNTKTTVPGAGRCRTAMRVRILPSCRSAPRGHFISSGGVVATRCRNGHPEL
jgi:glucose dehydrogenase